MAGSGKAGSGKSGSGIAGSGIAGSSKSGWGISGSGNTHTHIYTREGKQLYLPIYVCVWVCYSYMNQYYIFRRIAITVKRLRRAPLSVLQSFLIFSISMTLPPKWPYIINVLSTLLLLREPWRRSQASSERVRGTLSQGQLQGRYQFINIKSWGTQYKGNCKGRASIHNHQGLRYPLNVLFQYNSNH